MGRSYIEGCNSDVCTTRWWWNPIFSYISMIRTTDCCETLSETVLVRTPCIFLTFHEYCGVWRASCIRT
jgi:hypothetical protein